MLSNYRSLHRHGSEFRVLGFPFWGVGASGLGVQGGSLKFCSLQDLKVLGWCRISLSGLGLRVLG